MLCATGRGWACTAHLNSGVVMKGFLLWLPSGHIQIRSLEAVRAKILQPKLIGLTLEPCTDELLAELKAATKTRILVAPYSAPDKEWSNPPCVSTSR